MRRILLGILGAGILVMGCTTNRGSMANETEKGVRVNKLPQVTTTNSVADTVVQLYSVGGATGMFLGYLFSSHGEVRHFTRNAAGQTVQEVRIMLAPDSTRRLLQRLLTTGIFSHPIQRTGNMTSYFVFRTAQKTFRVSWVNDANIPADFREWYIQAIKKCQEWIQHNQ